MCKWKWYITDPLYLYPLLSSVFPTWERQTEAEFLQTRSLHNILQYDFRSHDQIFCGPGTNSFEMNCQTTLNLSKFSCMWLRGKVCYYHPKCQKRLFSHILWFLRKFKVVIFRTICLARRKVRVNSLNFSKIIITLTNSFYLSWPWHKILEAEEVC